MDEHLTPEPEVRKLKSQSNILSRAPAARKDPGTTKSGILRNNQGAEHQDWLQISKTAVKFQDICLKPSFNAYNLVF